MKDDLMQLSIKEARAKLRAKEISAVELLAASKDAIKARDTEVHAFLEVFNDAEASAKEADRRIAAGEDTPLLGIPIARKDNIVMKGQITTAGSKMLERYVGAYDATVIKKLVSAGAVIVGRTNLDEFAMGSSTEHSAFGVTKNPHDLSRVPGGSSGGSAAAVAMNGVLGALGSDTGGSIRQPASFCGVIGLKPTYGAVSRFGLIAMGSSLDVIGPFGKTIDDVEAIFTTIRGYDPNDATSLPDGGDPAAPQKIRIGVPRAFLENGVEASVMRNFERSLKTLENAGHEIVDIELPKIEHSLAVYYVVMPAEVSSNLARFDGVKYGLHVDGENLWSDYQKTRREGFGSEPRRRILLGAYVLSAGYADQYYKKAIAVREMITDDFRNAFTSVDLIATPTTPGAAFQFGAKSDPLSMYLEDIFTVPANLTGMPAISIPSGTVKEGAIELPTGIQFTAPHRGEATLFAAGRALGF
jgi:aspartyl-tRNA(Asn)/glutamyl-tRNA(Gln) amidotransferase subunit A